MTDTAPVIKGLRRDSFRVRVGYSVQVLYRMLICVVLTLLFSLGFEALAIFAMLVFSMLGLRTLSLKSEVSFILTVVVVAKLGWLLTALLSYASELPTLALSDVRYATFSGGRTGVLVFFSAQMVYILSMATYKLPNETLWHGRNQNVQFFFLALSAAVSFAINGVNFIGFEVYTGNIQDYWGGLPLIFLLFLSAAYVLGRTSGLTAFLLFNVIFGYWLLTGNRSEVLFAFVIVNFFFIISRYGIDSQRLRFFLLFSALLGAFMVFSLIGLIRHLEFSVEDSVFQLIFGSIIQDDRLFVQTIGASVYSSLAAVDVMERFGYQYGAHYIGQLVNTIPSFLEVPWERYRDPFESYFFQYDMIGGFGLMGESLMNFGYFGPGLMAFLLLSSLRFFAARSAESQVSAIALVLLAFYSQRYFFYGYVYLHNALFFVAVLWMAARVLNFGAFRN